MTIHVFYINCIWYNTKHWLFGVLYMSSPHIQLSRSLCTVAKAPSRDPVKRSYRAHLIAHQRHLPSRSGTSWACPSARHSSACLPVSAAISSQDTPCRPRFHCSKEGKSAPSLISCLFFSLSTAMTRLPSRFCSLRVSSTLPHGSLVSMRCARTRFPAAPPGDTWPWSLSTPLDPTQRLRVSSGSRLLGLKT